jgi:uncharacterized repeat protein (TIGR01451 family)
MRPPDRPTRIRAGYAWLLAIVPAAALAFATAGAAAPAGSTDLRIVKTDSPDPVTVNSTLTYTLEVADLGPATATGVTVTDQLPKGVDFVSAIATTGQCDQRARKVTCRLGALGTEAGMYAVASTVTIVAIPRQVGTIANTASVKGDQKDPVAANDKATATTTVIGGQVSCRGVPATIVGTRGNDVLTGTSGPDVISALGGDDTVRALAGRDLICAGTGHDYVGGGSALDRIFGGAGRDRVNGGGGPDRIKGNRGADVLRGNRGADRIFGGPGFDRCRGGAGFDSLRGCEL